MLSQWVDQSKTSPAAIAVIFAVAIWSMQQRAIEDSTPVETRFAPEVRHVEPSGPSKAKGDLRTLFSADDYPVSALSAGEEGTVEAQLAIDESGRVRDCTIVRSSGSVSLDKATRDIFWRRARFLPARDASGNPVPDRVETPPITWRLEG